MTENIYKEAVDNIFGAFAYHKAVFDKNGKMVDYVFLDVNQAFEVMTGIKREDIINKRFVYDMAKNKDHAKEWVKIYEEIFQTKGLIEFDKFSKEFNRYYRIKAFPVEDDCFVTLFLDMTFEIKMQEIVKYLSENMGEDIDYNELAEFAHDVTGADYTALNIFDDNYEAFTTVAVVGLSKNIKKAMNILNLDLSGKKWTFDPTREEKIKNQMITRFDKLHDLVGESLPKLLVEKIEKSFNIGNTVVAKITKGGKTIGDFTMLFKDKKELQNSELFKIYLSQVGLFIEKTKLENSLRLNQRRLYTLAEHAPVGFLTCNIKGQIQFASKRVLELIDSPSYEETKSINLFELPVLKKSKFPAKLNECMKHDKQMTFEMPYRSVWGKDGWFKVHINTNKEDNRVIGANIVIDDISIEKLNEEALIERIHIDALTHAYNRYALETILVESLQVAKDRHLISCIVLLDIDDFKKINDTYGHATGDKILKYLSTRVKRELKINDLIVRTGGDEFLIYLHDIKDENNAEIIIKRIYDKISTEYRIEDILNEKKFSLAVGFSMGAVFFPEHGDDGEKLMAKADEALYRAKANGKANYIIEN